MATQEGEGHYSDVPHDRDELAKMLGGHELPPFSEQEAEQLGAFKTTVNAINHAETMLDEGKTPPVVAVSKDGHTTRSTLNEQQVFKMKTAAADMYADNFYGNDKMQTAANAIVEKEKKAAEERRGNEPQKRALNDTAPASTPIPPELRGYDKQMNNHYEAKVIAHMIPYTKEDNRKAAQAVKELLWSKRQSTTEQAVFTHVKKAAEKAAKIRNEGAK